MIAPMEPQPTTAEMTAAERRMQPAGRRCQRCPTILSRYNSASLCAVCDRAARERAFDRIDDSPNRSQVYRDTMAQLGTFTVSELARALNVGHATAFGACARYRAIGMLELIVQGNRQGKPSIYRWVGR